MRYFVYLRLQYFSMLLYDLIRAEWYFYFNINIGCLVCESFSVITLPFLCASFSLQMTEQRNAIALRGLSLDTSGVAPIFDRQLIQSIVDQLLAVASKTLVKSVDGRLEEFKRCFLLSSSNTPHNGEKDR